MILEINIIKYEAIDILEKALEAIRLHKNELLIKREKVLIWHKEECFH